MQMNPDDLACAACFQGSDQNATWGDLSVVRSRESSTRETTVFASPRGGGLVACLTWRDSA